MVWEELIFVDQNTDSLFEMGSFKSKYVSKEHKNFKRLLSNKKYIEGQY